MLQWIVGVLGATIWRKWGEWLAWNTVTWYDVFKIGIQLLMRWVGYEARIMYVHLRHQGVCMCGVSVDQSCELFWIGWRTFGFHGIRKCLDQESKHNLPANGTEFSRNLTSFFETRRSSGRAVVQDPNGTHNVTAAVLLPSPYCDGKALTSARTSGNRLPIQAGVFTPSPKRPD